MEEEMTDDDLLQRHLDWECEWDCPFCIDDDDDDEIEEEGRLYDEY
jgi:hypothetical protein